MASERLPHDDVFGGGRPSNHDSRAPAHAGAAVVAFFLLALASLLGLAQPLVAGRIVESVGDQESVIARLCS